MSIWGVVLLDNIFYDKLTHKPEEALNFQSDWIFINTMVHLPQEMKLWYINKLLHQLHLTIQLTPHGSIERDFPTCVTSCIQYA